MPSPIPAVPLELKPNGELIVHGRGAARFTMQLQTEQHHFDFEKWSASGAEQSAAPAEVTFGRATVLASGETEVFIQAGPDDLWFFFIAEPYESLGEPVLVPDAPPYTPTRWFSHTDGGRRLFFLYKEHPDAVKRIRALPWAVDGLGPVSSARHFAAYALAEARWAGEALFERLIALQWVQGEDVSHAEASAIGALRGIGHRSPESMEQLLGMPFLDTLETLDFRALSAMGSLARDDRLEDVLGHPALAGGVTDEHTDIIALMGSHAVWSAGYELELLDTDRVVTVRRTVDLPLQDGVPFSVIWPGGSGTIAKAERTMETVIDAVTLFEEFMDIPYPQPYVIVMVADLTAAGGGGGGSGMISVDPPYHDSEDILSHEAAHTYWPFWPSWIAEGAATFMDLYYQSTRAGTLLPTPRGCDDFDNLRQLEALDLSSTHPCDYSLGSGVFLDLYGAMGHDPFREAFGRLYTWLDDEALLARCGRAEGKGECYVRAAFVEYMPEHAAVTGEIIDRHFHGVP